MSKLGLNIYLSYSQLCIFASSLAQPFNDWSDRNYSQGFSWRPGSVSFRALFADGDHKVNLFINEPIQKLGTECIRAFRVPFESFDGKIEIGSISDLSPLEIPAGKYSLQVEFLNHAEGGVPEINIRFNEGETDFEIIRADVDIELSNEFDLIARPAT
ncbi:MULTISPECIES: competence protein ComJ [Methylomonas]|uniref:Competence protein J (ComJ) n=2 Tax=Methylomonas TaxID=416 RepID=A0A126T347_9GAMM|nr:MULTISPECIES: competence protein ComJ [Methylomonas]AMK76516.1 hypothetical protein JT25_008420 [Methylomonas denitrificans]OAH98773.1 hypothetical protein A1342_13160 [Methylomonas methanica]TCV88550.1 competence protein J (ComJ) [Methylomonas methanica]